MWLRGLLKFAAVVLVAGAGGMGLGIAISELTGDDDAPPSVATQASTETTQAPTETAEATSSVPAATATTTPDSDQDPLEQVRVTVGSAVLHPAATPSGRARNRARLGVRVTVVNRGTQRVVLPRPSLLAARQRVPTNAAADAPATHLEAIDAGQTVRVTLQFETAGAVTEQLTTQKRARVLVAGRSSPIVVTVGPPVAGRSSAAP